MFSIPEKVEDDEVWNGSRRLLVGILNQAIEDVRLKPGYKPLRKDSEHSKRRWSSRVIARSMANWWVFGKYGGDDDYTELQMFGNAIRLMYGNVLNAKQR